MCSVELQKILKDTTRLKPIDIVVLKKLSEVVNVVPVIAKSDSLTIEERQAFKHRVRTMGARLGKNTDGLIMGNRLRLS